MNLKELSSPIRLYWDIGHAGDAGTPDYRKIAGEIAANKVLSLQVTESSPLLSHACLTILDELKDKMVSLSLVAHLSALDAATIAVLRRLPVKTLFVLIESRSELGHIDEISRKAEGRPAVGIAFHVTKANYLELPEVLSFCLDQNIANLVLPMQRLVSGEECFSLSSEERKELTSRFKETVKPVWMKIIIHDPLLWRAFFPTVEFPDVGCQAANTMLYISPNADAYPCPSLPVKIGSLTRTSLREVIFSDRKKEFRKTLLATPSECRECGELSRCKGGCRGRAYVISGSLDSHDPACKP